MKEYNFVFNKLIRIRVPPSASLFLHGGSLTLIKKKLWYHIGLDWKTKIWYRRIWQGLDFYHQLRHLFMVKIWSLLTCWITHFLVSKETGVTSVGKWNMNLVSNEFVRVKLPLTDTVKTLQSLSMFQALDLHHVRVVQDTRSDSDCNR